ncbi:MAG: MerR family transcriptional regulator [Desulfovibrionales bacterium]|nr:MerR family transcriptional regulator [Desulfovibrionales bacterium]
MQEFLGLTGLSEDMLVELIRMEWIQPARTVQDEYLFMSQDVVRVCKFQRLCTDFELSPVAGIIIVDLLERINRLEHTLKSFSRQI